MKKKRINFDTDMELYKEFYKKLIDQRRTMTEVFTEFMYKTVCKERTNKHSAQAVASSQV